VLSAGFARRDITPKEPCFLVGYPHVSRTSTGVHDPLFASVLCLKKGETTLVMVSLDLLFVSAEWTKECRGKITRETGIPSENILLGATHTHSGPHTTEILAWKDDPVVPPVDSAYLDFLCIETTAAVVEAWRKREPAEAAWTSTDVSGLAGGNRIASDGPEDPEAGLLVIRRLADQSPLAVISVYGMHPTVLHEDSTLISGDFIAFTRQEIEEAFPSAGMVYLNGLCGNQSPRRAVNAQTFTEAERLGRRLGKRMLEALRAVDGYTADLPLVAKTATLRLQGKSFPSVPVAEANLAAARERYADLLAEGAPHTKVRTAECTVFGAEEVLTLATAELTGEAQAARKRYRNAEIQLFRIGSRCLVGWPGEFFVEYGLEIKRRSGMPTFISTMSNGELHGYIVTPEAEKSNGYEAQMSLFPAANGERFVRKTLELIETLA